MREHRNIPKVFLLALELETAAVYVMQHTPINSVISWSKSFNKQEQTQMPFPKPNI